LQLEKEDLITAEAIGQQNTAIQMPERIVDVQYYHRYRRYPSKEERLTYMSDQAHGHTLKGVGDSILNDHRNIAWADLDRMFHCKRGDLRLAQEFLRERRQDPRLAGLHWEGGDTTAFEAGETAAMEAGDQRRRLPTVSSSSSEEGIVEQSQTVTLGLPTMRQGLGEIQGGLRAVRTPYELPDRYAAYIGISPSSLLIKSGLTMI
jgi:AcrR family transcriptional regulator